MNESQFIIDEKCNHATSKSVLKPLGLTAATSSADVAEKRFWTWHEYADNLKQRNERYHANS